VALLAGVLREDAWITGAIWCALLLLAIVLDAILGKPLAETKWVNTGFPAFSIARPESWQLELDFGRNTAPKEVVAALACDERLGLAVPLSQGQSDGSFSRFNFDFAPTRRGTATIQNAHIRWRGPFGLVWKQKRIAFDTDVAITTNIRGVQEEAVRWFSRYALFGSKADKSLGEGREFHELREFQTGMDKRTVDWKQSARHGKLLAKQFQTERNHNIIFALDSGRTMSEPVGTAPRIDRAIEAALLTALACLRGGDRAGFFAFDSKPRLSTGVLGGANAFITLQHVATQIDYSSEETNYVLGLASLSGALKRRSLIIVFTEFADQTAAQLMLEGIGRLLKRHLVVFVAFRDAELEQLAEAAPESPEAISRAVVAGSILSERELVLAKLRAMGAHIVEGRAELVGPSIISRYLDLKARDLL
jgi:uncharacterized protein (DUF58 family)